MTDTTTTLRDLATRIPDMKVSDIAHGILGIICVGLLVVFLLRRSIRS